MQYSTLPRSLVPRGPWYQKSSITELERTGDVDMKTQHCFPTGSEIACMSVISGEKRVIVLLYSELLVLQKVCSGPVV